MSFIEINCDITEHSSLKCSGWTRIFNYNIEGILPIDRTVASQLHQNSHSVCLSTEIISASLNFPGLLVSSPNERATTRRRVGESIVSIATSGIAIVIAAR